MIEKRAITSRPVDDLLARRWSGRAFDPDKHVTRDQLLSILEAARWAPSCWNDQPWRYLVWDKNDDAESYKKGFECVSENNKKWVVNSSVLMCAIASHRFTHNDKPNRWGEYDSGAASMSICLQAVSLGLMAHQMAGFDKDMVIEKFNVPENYTPMAMIAIGVPVNSIDDVPEENRERELAERSRNPLGNRFFDGTWGAGIE
ncbi:MAG TPA: nitroreductase family protein [bacterium]|jgi:nitroreductase